MGASLNTLSHGTVQVYHDYQVKDHGSEPWDIDHIVVTAEGIFLLETKARRKLKQKNKDGQDGYRVK
ncbi:MAG: nuclease-related domain-containing protein [Rubritalea sp.]|uniref:nuclease-related domain-containing protein n=1 Tax=Rubritalea sp. TaxID=2109375 RepID=UPI00324267CC